MKKLEIYLTDEEIKSLNKLNVRLNQLRKTNQEFAADLLSEYIANLKSIEGEKIILSSLGDCQ